MTTPDVEALRRQWEEQMEVTHDSLPPWYWSRPEREARRDAWVAARLHDHPAPTPRPPCQPACLGSLDR